MRRRIYSVSGTLLAMVCVAVFAVPPARAVDSDAFSITVAPPLFQLALTPGESWRSGIQVANINPYDITVYAQPMLFRPSGDGGQPEFYPPQLVNGIPSTETIAGWISVPEDGVVIPREQTVTLPLTIFVPKDASPGGHYAAILIGNKAPSDIPQGGGLSVTSSVASLVFLRVAGDVVERGTIREFSTEQSLYQHAEAHFALKFENQGNVHLQPQGDITIYNMFGKVRGYIPINQAGSYGNVLPGSMRTFAFTWKSDTGSWDIGRYKAVATVGYGDSEKQFVNSTVYFYILPVVPLLEVIGGLLFIVIVIGWSIKAYIRRALYIEGLRHAAGGSSGPVSTPANSVRSHEPRVTLGTLIRPIQAGIVDLRSVGASHTGHDVSSAGTHTRMSRYATLRAFVREYRTFFVFIAFVSAGWIVASAYFSDVLTYERAYQITVDKPE